MDRVFESPPGSTVLLMGNEAIVRGALEAGVSVATTYPGTPASEIGDTFARVAKKAGIYFEYSTNEKVATEVAIGAAVSGLRAIVSMKHVGVNVASDALMTFAYTGTRGGFVLITADDPSCHSSQNEQDNRYFAQFSGIPMLEPSSPQECYHMARHAFEISEKLEMPVMIRTTTRISHVRGPVRVGNISTGPSKGEFVKEPKRFVTVPAVARERHLILLRKLDQALALSDESDFNRISRVGNGGKGIGILTSSAAFNYSVDALRILGASADVMKLGFSFPLPRTKLKSFLDEHETVIVVEELEPIVETSARALVQLWGLGTRVLGKEQGLFPRAHELNQAIVARGLSRELEVSADRLAKALRDVPNGLPERPPVLCAGCPHSATYFAVNKVTKGNAIFASDIGCYTLGVSPPYSAADLLVCMGSSVGTAGGLAASNKLPVIAFIGDSTFFHAGIPALINAVHHGHKFLLMILDNETTAMTGHQPHPSSSSGPGGELVPVPIEDVVRGCGVKWMQIIDPYDTGKMSEAVKEALAWDGISTIIARRRCALIASRDKKGTIIGKRQIDQNECKKCRTCVTKFQCPAISSIDKVQTIDDGLCAGCGVCEQVCPFGAIKEVK